MCLSGGVIENLCTQKSFYTMSYLSSLSFSFCDCMSQVYKNAVNLTKIRTQLLYLHCNIWTKELTPVHHGVTIGLISHWGHGLASKWQEYILTFYLVGNWLLHTLLREKIFKVLLGPLPFCGLTMVLPLGTRYQEARVRVKMPISPKFWDFGAMLARWGNLDLRKKGLKHTHTLW